MTDDEHFARIRVAITLFVTVAMGVLLGWQSFHRVVPADHILNRADMPAISNWWGALLIPSWPGSSSATSSPERSPARNSSRVEGAGPLVLAFAPLNCDLHPQA